jgi:hypothetical protein
MRTNQIFSRHSVLALTIALTAAGCVEMSNPDVLDGEVTDESADAIDAKADAAGTSGYYAVRVSDDFSGAARDGFNYAIGRANAATTKCVGAAARPACFTDQLDISRITLSAEEKIRWDQHRKTTSIVGGHPIEFVVRGKFVKGPTGKLATFVATELWENRQPQGEADLFGTLVKVTKKSSQCHSLICAKNIAKLNSTAVAQVPWISWGIATSENLAAETLEANGTFLMGAQTSNDGMVSASLFIRMGR